MNLSEWRREIDKIDSEIIELLRKRTVLSQKIGMLKFRAGMQVVDSEREEAIILSILQQDMSEICQKSIANIYRGILGESRNIQQFAAKEINGTGVEI